MVIGIFLIMEFVKLRWVIDCFLRYRYLLLILFLMLFYVFDISLILIGYIKNINFKRNEDSLKFGLIW